MQYWVSQKLLPDDPGVVSVEWDTFNIGVLEEGRFRTIYSCWSQEDADYLISALTWYSDLQESGVMGGTPSPQKKVSVTRAKPKSKERK